MPTVSGFEVVRQIKQLYQSFNEKLEKDDKTRSVQVLRPVICYLSQLERQVMIKFMQEEESAEYYLAKPLPCE